jgi:hypothetical protein
LTGAPHNPEKRVQQVFGLENFTEADLEAIHVAELPPEAAAFDSEQTG